MVKEIYVIFIHLLEILFNIDLNRKKRKKKGGWILQLNKCYVSTA
jgi:hypothetical protein